MSYYSIKEIARNIFSVILGILMGLLIFLIVYSSVSIRLNTIERVNKEFIAKEARLYFGSFGLIPGALAGGALTTYIATRKEKVLSTLTGFILSAILIYLFSKNSFNFDGFKIPICVAVLLAGFLGSIVVSKKN